MPLTSQLIDQYGPIIIVLILAYNVVPSLVGKVMDGYTRNKQAQALAIEAPFAIANTALEMAAKQGERHDEMIDTLAQSVNDLRADMKRGFEEILSHLKKEKHP